MSDVLFMQCLEKGIYSGASTVACTALVGQPLSYIAAYGLGELIGVTTGNYVVHHLLEVNGEETVFGQYQIQESTKRIIVIAIVIFTDMLFIMASTYLTGRSLDYGREIRLGITFGFLDYFLDWSYLAVK